VALYHDFPASEVLEIVKDAVFKLISQAVGFILGQTILNANYNYRNYTN
jgi:hypothetical protein